MSLARSRWWQKWKKLSQREMALIIGSTLYIVLVALNLLAFPGPLLKYVSAALGFLLLVLAPELIRKKHDNLLIALVVGIAIGNTALQIQDDASKDGALARLSEEVQKNRLQQWTDLEVAEAERRLLAKEPVEEQPIDAIRTLQHSPAGFVRKANRVAVRAMLEESRLLVSRPQLAPRVLSFPPGAAKRLQAFDALRREEGSKQSAPLWDAVATRLGEEAAYRETATFLTDHIVPDYRSLERLLPDRGPVDAGLLAQMRAIETKLDARLAVAPLAGLFNHAGVLAMAQGIPEVPHMAGRRALGRYYAAAAADADHIPAYESIAYASWSVNQESRTALEYAKLGMVLASRYPGVLRSELDELTKNYGTVAKVVPQVARSLAGRQAAASALVEGLTRAFEEGSANLLARLRLLYAYCSAIELQNETEARAYARALHASDPKDAEYQDALGLVLLMFARTPAELDEADRLFVQAARNEKSLALTKKLVDLHRAKVDEKRRRLGFRKS